MMLELISTCDSFFREEEEDEKDNPFPFNDQRPIGSYDKEPEGFNFPLKGKDKAPNTKAGVNRYE